MHPHGRQTFREAALQTLSSLGVIWGDIGTSPLYTFSSVYNCETTCEIPQLDDLKQTFSVIFWTLTFVTFLKYIVIVIRFDYHGEGGIFALLLNVTRKSVRPLGKNASILFLIVACIGASAMIADGFLTPALSVLSAIEGLRASPLLSEDQVAAISTWVVPITCVILLVLFVMQWHGSTKVGTVFGPIMLLYFLSIAAIGLYNLFSTGYWEVLEGLSPHYTFRFFFTGRFTGYGAFKKLSSIVLCVTGAEALYSDLGHYSKRAIWISWCALVYPALTLVYAGQASAMAANPNVVVTAFWLSVPDSVYIPMLILATLATVVASQAMITGCFSLVSQAVTLGLFPRVRVVNTDPKKATQIYVPEVNLVLGAGTIILVIAFKHSVSLAGAYGISVVMTFNITTILVGAVLYTSRWPKVAWYWIVLALLPILTVDMFFLASNLAFKITHGGWITLTMTAVISSAMLSWKFGNHLIKLARDREADNLKSSMLDHLTTFGGLSSAIQSGRVKRGHGIGVFLSSSKLHLGRRLALNSTRESAANALEQMLHDTEKASDLEVNRKVSNISGVVPESGSRLPSALSLYLKVTGSIQPVVVLLHVAFDQDKPQVSIADRVAIEEIVTGSDVGIYSATVTFGFAEPLSEVDMTKIVKQWILEQIPAHRSLTDLFEPSFPNEDSQLWYFLYKEERLAKGGSNLFRKAFVWWFSALHVLSRSAYVFLNLPANDCVQMGGLVFI